MINNEKKICILGAGGFGREVLCCLIDGIETTNLKIDEIACFMVSDEHFKENEIMGHVDSFNINNQTVSMSVADRLLKTKP